MAVGLSFLSFTNAIAYPGPEISDARAIPATQLAPNALLRRSSFRAGHLWEPCPRGQLEGRAFKERKLRAALSQSVDAYRRVGAPNLENVDIPKLVQALEEASSKGREVIMAAVDKPRSIDYKGATDLVTDTDRKSEEAILEVVRKYFPDHLILGEEGGVSGDPSSEYLWCVDPLDGTTNFAQNYPSFAVSIAVLYKGRPVAASVVEFAGGPFIWNTRTFIASSGGGAFCNGRKIQCSQRDQVERSLFVTGFGYEHDEAWATNIDLFKEFTDKSRGVRRLGAAAVDMCHVALGIVEAYWEYRLKPWDMAAGVLIVEEAGGKVTCMDGGDFCVFDRSVLVSNGILHDELLKRIAPPTQKLIKDGFDFSQWFKPKGYISEEVIEEMKSERIAPPCQCPVSEVPAEFYVRPFWWWLCSC